MLHLTECQCFGTEKSEMESHVDDDTLTLLWTDKKGKMKFLSFTYANAYSGANLPTLLLNMPALIQKGP